MSPLRRRLAIAAGVVGLLAGAALVWRAQVPQVPVVEAQPAPLVQTLLFSARVAVPSRVELGATITGRVVQVLVAEGAAVRAGERLVQLEDAELRAVLAQAEASERQATARLAGLRGSGRGGSAAALAQADSVLRAAEAEHRRTQGLVAQGFVSPARVDESERSLAVARAQRDAATAQAAALAESGSDIAQAEAQLALARAATQAARARAAQAELRAPAAGRVLQRAVEPGQIVQPGRVLLLLALDGALELEASVDERFLPQLRPGQAARVRADAFPDQAFAATVARLAPKVDAQRGAVDVHLTVAAPPAFLREDMTLTVELETGRRERSLALPLAALRDDDAMAQRATVWVLRDGRATSQPVQTGLRTLQQVEVLGGLQPGDAVLVGGVARLGDRVRADVEAGRRLATARPGERDVGSAIGSAMGR